MTLITEAEKTAFRTTAGEIFTALNSVSWKTLTACECVDEYGIADPECEECGGDGVTELSSFTFSLAKYGQILFGTKRFGQTFELIPEKSNTIAADVQEITGDERVAVEAGILKRGDLIVRTLTTNQVKVGDIITHSGKDYEVKYVRPDQLELYLEIGCGKRA